LNEPNQFGRARINGKGKHCPKGKQEMGGRIGTWRASHTSRKIVTEGKKEKYTRKERRILGAILKKEK